MKARPHRTKASSDRNIFTRNAETVKKATRRASAVVRAATMLRLPVLPSFLRRSLTSVMKARPDMTNASSAKNIFTRDEETGFPVTRHCILVRSKRNAKMGMASSNEPNGSPSPPSAS